MEPARALIPSPDMLVTDVFNTMKNNQIGCKIFLVPLGMSPTSYHSVSSNAKSVQLSVSKDVLDPNYSLNVDVFLRNMLQRLAKLNQIPPNSTLTKLYIRDQSDKKGDVFREVVPHDTPPTTGLEISERMIGREVFPKHRENGMNAFLEFAVEIVSPSMYVVPENENKTKGNLPKMMGEVPPAVSQHVAVDVPSLNTNPVDQSQAIKQPPMKRARRSEGCFFNKTVKCNSNGPFKEITLKKDSNDKIHLVCQKCYDALNNKKMCKRKCCYCFEGERGREFCCKKKHRESELPIELNKNLRCTNCNKFETEDRKKARSRKAKEQAINLTMDEMLQKVDPYILYQIHLKIIDYGLTKAHAPSNSQEWKNRFTQLAKQLKHRDTSEEHQPFEEYCRMYYKKLYTALNSEFFDPGFADLERPTEEEWFKLCSEKGNPNAKRGATPHNIPAHSMVPPSAHLK